MMPRTEAVEFKKYCKSLMAAHQANIKRSLNGSGDWYKREGLAELFRDDQFRPKYVEAISLDWYRLLSEIQSKSKFKKV